MTGWLGVGEDSRALTSTGKGMVISVESLMSAMGELLGM
jgi:hypothetical protein